MQLCLSQALVVRESRSPASPSRPHRGQDPFAERRGESLQLDELQPQRLDPRDVAVQRGTVDYPTHQQRVGHLRARFEGGKRSQQSGRQRAGPEPWHDLSAEVASWLATT